MSEEFSEEFLDERRQELESRRAELINRSHLARNEMRDREKVPGDAVDESTDEQGTSNSLQQRDRERNLLAQINAALQRIGDGSYGYCLECGEPIAKPRLRARPMATLCIDDREALEKSERRHHAKRPGMFSPTDRSS